MSEQAVGIQEPSTPTKKMRTLEATVNGNVVETEAVILSTNGSDTYDARQIRSLSQSNPDSVRIYDSNGNTITNHSGAGLLGAGLSVVVENTGTQIIPVNVTLAPIADSGGNPTTSYPPPSLPINGVEGLLLTSSQPFGSSNVIQTSLDSLGTTWYGSQVLVASPGSAAAGLVTRPILTGSSADNGTNSSLKGPVLPARANTSAPSWTDGRQVPLSTDLAGNTRVLAAGASADNGTASSLKAPVLAGTANAAAPSWTEGRQVPLSTDLSGNLRMIVQNSPTVNLPSSYFNSQGQLQVTQSQGGWGLTGEGFAITGWGGGW